VLRTTLDIEEEVEVLGKASTGCLERWVTWGRDSKAAFGRDIYARAPRNGKG